MHSLGVWFPLLKLSFDLCLMKVITVTVWVHANVAKPDKYPYTCKVYETNIYEM